MGVGSASLKMLAASLARYGGQVALLAVIAHTAGPVAVGQFALALAITAPIFILTGLGLRTVVVTLKTPFTSGDVLAVRATTTALALAASLAAGGLVPSADWRVVALVAAIKVADAFSDAIYGLYQVAGRFTAIPVLATFQSVAYVAAVLAAGLATGEVLAALGCGAAAACLVSAAMVAHTLRDSRPAAAGQPGRRPQRPRRALVRAGVPSGLAQGAVSLVASVPQLVLAETAGAAAIGRYAVLIYVIVAAELVMNAITQAWLPAARAVDIEGRFTGRFVAVFAGKITALQVPVAAGILVAATVAFPLVFGPSFTIRTVEYAPLAVALLAAPAMFITSAAMNVHNLYGPLMRNSLVVLAVCVATSLLVVPGHGTTGALWVAAACVGLRGLLAAARVATHHRQRPGLAAAVPA